MGKRDHSGNIWNSRENFTAEANFGGWISKQLTVVSIDTSDGGSESGVLDARKSRKSGAKENQRLFYAATFWSEDDGKRTGTHVNRFYISALRTMNKAQSIEDWGFKKARNIIEVVEELLDYITLHFLIGN